MQETHLWLRVRSMGQEDSPGGGNGNPLQSSCLEKPMDRGAWQATVHAVAKNHDAKTRWSTCAHTRVRAHTHTHTHTRMKLQGVCSEPLIFAASPKSSAGRQFSLRGYRFQWHRYHNVRNKSQLHANHCANTALYTCYLLVECFQYPFEVVLSSYSLLGECPSSEEQRGGTGLSAWVWPHHVDLQALPSLGFCAHALLLHNQEKDSS